MFNGDMPAYAETLDGISSISNLLAVVSIEWTTLQLDAKNL